MSRLNDVEALFMRQKLLVWCNLVRSSPQLCVNVFYGSAIDCLSRNFHMPFGAMLCFCLQVLAEIAFAKKRIEDRKVMAKEKRRAELVRKTATGSWLLSYLRGFQ